MRQILLLIFLMPFIFYGQIQIGSDIDGEAAGDYYGFSISLSLDGNIVAIGAPYNAINGLNSGLVRVYENVSGTWTQVGNSIYGQDDEDSIGNSISLSADGNIVAIGATLSDSNGFDSGLVRIYQNVSGIWTQIGQDIDGESIGDRFGHMVCLSSNGSIVASSSFFDDGHVRIYENIAGVWTQIGNDINGEANGDWSGYSMSLSSDGNVVSIGAPENDGINGARSGQIRVYENISGVWAQVGSDVEGDSSNNVFGRTVSLSSDGTIFATAGYVNGDSSGIVRVYKNISGTWTQVGNDINGEASGDLFGTAISISSDASMLAISSYLNDGNGTESGHVRIYKNILGVWTQIGNDIDGEASGDHSGYSISLSSNANIVAIGATENDGVNGIDSGHVRVYDLNAVLSTESFNKDYFSFYPNPVNDVLNINLNEGLELKQVNIYNILSQYLYSTKELRIDTNNLKSGIYFVEIVTDKGKSAKKVVIE